METKMFRAVISDTKAWKNSIDAIAALIDEGTLQIDEKGIKLRAMDPSQIALVDLELPSSSFEEYKVEKPVNIGIDFTELSKITKRSRAEDKIELSLENRLKMVFKGETTRSFSLAIIESTSSPPKEPNIEFTADVKIGANMLKEALKDAELVSNHVVIKLNDGFGIKADGDAGSVDIKFQEENILGMNVKEEVRAVFALDHLNNLLKASDPQSIILIKMRTDAPLRIEYAIGDGRVIYYLAPRIESV
ncbi:MAG: proliferating cell nuclear antigen (pcna) [Candidatus Altiarchaeales archaeon]|nr:MAG: proliferating cell nuclear antigen (pcna) [Candidatus Altiarchaeales archaeon]HDI73354.1 proliferating cell nuclear antigen (pcna) [Candidatus Altiarchaeales archaeon]